MSSEPSPSTSSSTVTLPKTLAEALFSLPLVPTNPLSNLIGTFLDPFVDSEDVQKPSSTPKRRLNYTLEFKNRVIQFAEQTNNCQAAHKFQVPRQCIQRWRQIKPELEEQIHSPYSSKKKRLGGGGRPLKNVELDEKLEEWLKQKMFKKEKVTGKMIKDYAMSINGNDGFKASNGWLQRFMIRHGLAAPPTPKESTSSARNPLPPDGKMDTVFRDLMESVIDTGQANPEFLKFAEKQQKGAESVEEEEEEEEQEDDEEEEEGGDEVYEELEEIVRSQKGAEPAVEKEKEFDMEAWLIRIKESTASGTSDEGAEPREELDLEAWLKKEAELNEQ